MRATFPNLGFDLTVTVTPHVHRDDLSDDPADRCPHSIYDRADGTTSECSLPSGHAPTAHDSGDGVLWTDGEHWKDEESNLNDLPDDPRALIARELGPAKADTFLGLLDEHGWTVTRKGDADPVRCGGCRDLGPHVDGCDGLTK